MTPIYDSLTVAVGGAVDDLNVVVNKLRGEEAISAEIDQADAFVIGAIQEVAPVGVRLHHAPIEQF